MWYNTDTKLYMKELKKLKQGNSKTNAKVTVYDRTYSQFNRKEKRTRR